MSAAVDNARRQWEEGYRRYLSEHDLARWEQLSAEIEAVTDELRRRVGGTYTLDELARVYDGSDSWTREAVAGSAAAELPGWAADVSTAGDAAFHVYARGAQDYAP